MRRCFLRAAAAAAFVSALPAAAHDYRAGDIAIGHPWTRAIGAAAPTAAGYMSLRNAGTEPDRLVGASSPRARSVEIHQMTMTDGVMRMRPLGAGIAIPPGGTAWLRPSGTHLMLIGPAGPFARGEAVPVTLRFERAGEVTIELEVAAAGAREAAGHGGH
jgi:periplasmic copper chaperone A